MIILGIVMVQNKYIVEICYNLLSLTFLSKEPAWHDRIQKILSGGS